MRTLAKVLVLLGILGTTGCGDEDYTYSRLPAGEPLTHVVIQAPVHGACYKVNDSIWVENEGSHVDVYNNNTCSHGPAPKAHYCNDVYPLDVCAVGNIFVYIEGSHSSLKIHVLTYL